MEEVNTQLWLPTLLWIIRLKLQFHQYAIKCLLHLMYLLKLSRWEDLEHLLKKLVGLKIMQKLFIKNTEFILQILEFWFLLVLLLSEFFKHFCPNNFGIFIWNFFFCSTDDACQYWINERILQSPYFPDYFLADNKGCQWTVTAPEDHIIALEFKQFKVSLIKSSIGSPCFTWFTLHELS